jgi:hypothetical protein
MSISVTIPISTTTSAAFQLGGQRIGAIRTPAALTGVALTFLASDSEAGTYLPVWSDAAAVSLVVAPSRHIALTLDESNALATCNWLKLVSGATEVAERVFSVELEMDPN